MRLMSQGYYYLKNTVSGAASTVAGGTSNTASGITSTISGGYSNTASGSVSTISGGNGNTASGQYSTIGGGSGNIASVSGATVSGGVNNSVIGTAYGTVGGGYGNGSNGAGSTVAGGINNTLSGNGSFAAGQNTTDINGIIHNGVFLWGDNSTTTVLAATGDNQFLVRAAGGVGIGTNSPVAQLHVASNTSNPQAELDQTLADDYARLRLELVGSNYWDIVAGGPNDKLSIFAAGYGNAMTVDPSFGGVGIGTDSPVAQLHVSSASDNPQIELDQALVNDYARVRLRSNNAAGFCDIAVGGPNDDFNIFSPGYGNVISINPTNNTNLMYMGNGARLTAGGTWTNASDRNLKTNFAAVKTRTVLSKVLAMPIQSWSYKVEPSSIRHLGPMAQDFFAAFSLGEDDKQIATVDEGGVALAAIQGLNEKLEQEVKELREGASRKDAQITAQQGELENQNEQIKLLREELARQTEDIRMVQAAIAQIRAGSSPEVAKNAE